MRKNEQIFSSSAGIGMIESEEEVQSSGNSKVDPALASSNTPIKTMRSIVPQNVLTLPGYFNLILTKISNQGSN